MGGQGSGRKPNPKPQQEQRTPIATGMFLPNHSGIKRFVDSREALELNDLSDVNANPTQDYDIMMWYNNEWTHNVTGAFTGSGGITLDNTIGRKIFGGAVDVSIDTTAGLTWSGVHNFTATATGFGNSADAVILSLNGATIGTFGFGNDVFTFDKDISMTSNAVKPQNIEITPGTKYQDRFYGWINSSTGAYLGGFQGIGTSTSLSSIYLNSGRGDNYNTFPYYRFNFTSNAASFAMNGYSPSIQQTVYRATGGGFGFDCFDLSAYNTTNSSSGDLGKIGMYGSMANPPVPLYFYIDATSSAAYNNTFIKIDAGDKMALGLSSNTRPTTAMLEVYGNVITHNIEPVTDDTYYLGKNDDDSPKAWKGLILKDTADGKYYRIEVTNGVVTATDLTD